MNCRRAKNLIFEFVDGLTDETLKLDLERHLGECPECDTLASQLTRSLDLVHRAPQEELDENFNWKVRLAIHKERNAIQGRAASQSSLFRDWNFRYAASAVSGFAVILVAGWIAINAGLTMVPVESDPRLAALGLSSEVERDLDERKAPSGRVAANEQVPGKLEASDDQAVVAREEAEAIPEMLKRDPSTPRLRSVVPSRSNSPGGMVSDGLAQTPAEQPRPGGAIDLVDNTAEMDSLVHLETKGMSEEDRVLYFQKRIEQLHIHLEKCKRADHR